MAKNTRFPLGLFAFVYALSVAVGADFQTVRSLQDSGQRALAEFRYDDAVQHYEDLKKIADTEEILMTSALGLIQGLFAAGNYGDALRTVDEIPGLYAQFPGKNPSLPKRLLRENVLKLEYWRGRIFLARKNYRKAIGVFKKVFEVTDPDFDAMAHYYHGFALMELGEKDKALEGFSRLTAIADPTSIRAQVGRTGMLELLLREKNWDEFALKYKESSEKNKGRWDIESKFLFIRAALARKRYTDALKFYREQFLDVEQGTQSALEKNHLKVERYYLVLRDLGHKLVKSGEYRMAREYYVDLEPRLKIDSQRRQILVDMAVGAYDAMVAADADEQTHADAEFWYDLASDDLENYLEGYPASSLAAQVMYYQGQIHLSRGRGDKAFEMFKSAFNHKSAPTAIKYDAALQLGRYCRERNLNDQALLWLAAAGRLPAGKLPMAQAKFELAELFHDLKRYSEASSVFAEIAEKFSDLPLVHKARFNHGLSVFKAGEFKNAALALRSFLSNSLPTNEYRPAALYYYGVSLRLSHRLTESRQVLLEGARMFRDTSYAPKALLEAAETARAAMDEKDAVRLCTEVIEKYPQSPEVPQAIYNRIYFNLFLGYAEEQEMALADEQLFFAEENGYPQSHPEFAAEILCWFGNYFYNRRELELAENYFIRVCKQYADQPHMPEALYEAAKCAYEQVIEKEGKDYSRSIDYLTELESLPPERFRSSRVLAQAYYLHGDILTMQDSFVEAETYFTNCRDNATGTSLEYRAIGRIGDMKYSRAHMAQTIEEKEALLEGAIQAYSRIIDEFAVGDMVDIARYYRGIVHMMLGNEKSAENDYRAVFERFFTERTAGNHPDWFFFVKSGRDLAEYYQRMDRVLDAVQIYERIAGAEISSSKWAGQQAAKLRGAGPLPMPEPQVPTLEPESAPPAAPAPVVEEVTPAEGTTAAESPRPQLEVPAGDTPKE